MLSTTTMSVLSIVRRNFDLFAFSEPVDKQCIRGENGSHCVHMGNWSFQGTSRVVSQETRLHGRFCKSSEVRLRARGTKKTGRLMESTLDYKQNRRYGYVAGRWRHTKRRTEAGESRGLKWFFLNIFSSWIYNLLTIVPKYTREMRVDARKILAYILFENPVHDHGTSSSIWTSFQTLRNYFNKRWSRVVSGEEVP